MKEVNAPLLFDGEHGIALHAMQWHRASSRGEGGSLIVFLQLRPGTEVYSRVTAGRTFNTRVCSLKSGILSSCIGHFGTLLKVLQANRDASRGEAGDPGSISNCYRDIGIPINFQEEAGIISL